VRVNPFGNYAQAGAVNVRDVGSASVKGRRIVVLSYWVPGQQYWYRLWINPAHKLILSDQIITPGHFISDRYYDLNTPVRIRPPKVGSP